MNKNLILAVVGLPGAGKTEASGYVVKKTGWPKVHFGDITAEGLRAQGLEVTEESERKFREDIRKQYGMGAYAILNLPKIRELYTSSNVLLESLYSWEEYLELKKEFKDNFKVLAIFASPETRSKRLQSRPERPLTHEEFESRDYSQIENLHQAGPIARANFMIINETSKEDLYAQIDQVLLKISI
jgi:dephospho-CoA kinase